MLTQCLNNTYFDKTSLILDGDWMKIAINSEHNAGANLSVELLKSGFSEPDYLS